MNITSASEFPSPKTKFACPKSGRDWSDLISFSSSASALFLSDIKKKNILCRAEDNQDAERPKPPEARSEPQKRGKLAAFFPGNQKNENREDPQTHRADQTQNFYKVGKTEPEQKNRGQKSEKPGKSFRNLVVIAESEL